MRLVLIFPNKISKKIVKNFSFQTYLLKSHITGDKIIHVYSAFLKLTVRQIRAFTLHHIYIADLASTLNNAYAYPQKNLPERVPQEVKNASHKTNWLSYKMAL